MKLYLFGWADTHEESMNKQFKLFEETIREIQPEQILHIPFARSPKTEQMLWWPNWFIKHINIWKAEYLNANNPVDIEKANNPLIIVTWWGQTANLLEKVQSSPRLLELIHTAKHIIWESSWSMFLAEYTRVKGQVGNKLVKALGIIPNTIIEPHYAQKRSQELLAQELQTTGMHYGIGIDEIAGIVFEKKQFPTTYKKIGEGNIEIIENP